MFKIMKNISLLESVILFEPLEKNAFQFCLKLVYPLVYFLIGHILISGRIISQPAISLSPPPPLGLRTHFGGRGKEEGGVPLAAPALFCVPDRISGKMT